MTEARQDLDVLRMAARQREWNTLQDTLKRLLAQLEPLLALEIAAVRAQEFLPRFEAYYPEARWVRELLLTVISYASAPEQLPDHAVTQFPSPGCGNYLSAVLDLARAVQMGVSPFERYSFITGALANLLLADLMEVYYRQHREAWTRLNDHADEIDVETGLTVRQAVTMRFWMDGEVAARDTAAWLNIADAVETKFNERLA